jgi:hypothetical protein
MDPEQLARNAKIDDLQQPRSTCSNYRYTDFFGQEVHQFLAVDSTGDRVTFRRRQGGLMILTAESDDDESTAKVVVVLNRKAIAGLRVYLDQIDEDIEQERTNDRS